MLKHSLSRSLTALALGLALAACSQPSNPRQAETDTAASSESASPAQGNAGIEQSVEKLFGGAKADAIQPSPIDGLMEVHIHGNVFYASPDGRYFMQGDMIEVATMKSQTEAARSAPRQAAIGDLNVDDSITYKAKNEKFEVYVFTDVTCPYCAKFHEDIKEYNRLGITVHYFAWPRAGAGSPAYDDMVSAWCAKDPKKAIDRLFKHQSIDKATCDNPVDEHLEMGRRMMVNGTPAVFSKDARQHGGYLPPQDLLSSLEGKPQQSQE